MEQGDSQTQINYIWENYTSNIQSCCSQFLWGFVYISVQLICSELADQFPNIFLFSEKLTSCVMEVIN